MSKVSFTNSPTTEHRKNTGGLNFKLLLLSLIIVALVVFPFANFAHADGSKYMAFTSDVHGYTDNLESWLRIIKNDGVNPLDRMVFGGDYPQRLQENTSWTIAQQCVEIVKDIYGSDTSIVLVQGNHDSQAGNYSNGLVYNGDDYAVYAISSSTSVSTWTFSLSEIADLEVELNEIAGSKPVFVTSHCPIHYLASGTYGSRTTGNAKALLDVLNDHENVIFMWGHNHTEGDAYYGQVMTKGFNIKTTSSDPGTDINFTYLAYGSMMSEDTIKEFGLVAELTQSESGTRIDFTYKDLQGNDRASESIVIGSYTPPEGDPIDSVEIIGIETPVAGAIPDNTAIVSGNTSVDSISWSPATSSFGYDTAYTVEVVLRPDSGYKFTSSTTATVNDNPATCSLKGNGSLSVSFTFPKTASPSGTLYQRVNSFEDGGVYLIVGESTGSGKNYALTSNVASSSYLAASEITVEGDYVPVSAVTEAMRWTADKAGNYTYLKSSGGYLHRVSGGDNINASETVKDQGKGGWLYNASENMLYTVSTNPEAPDHPFFLEYSSGNNYFKVNYDTDHTRIKLFKLVEEIPPTLSGWESEDGVWYYYDNGGNLVKGWLRTGGKWYYLDPATGAMQIGWKNVDGRWYYLNANSGAMRIGWLQSGGKWYYLNKNTGAMQTGWLQDGGKWYYLNKNSGAMQTGWVKSGSKWYYLEASGAMATSKWISGKYYVGSDGAMFVDSWTPDGYYVDKNGEWVKNRTP